MRLTARTGFRLILVVLAVAIIAWRLIPHHPAHPASGIRDLSVTSPLNQPGGPPAPAEAYPVYSALYQAPIDEPLVFVADSATDIPQVDGSCLKPSTPQQHQMTDAFVAANRQSHRWQPQFSIPQGYRVIQPSEASRILGCLDTHGKDAARCSADQSIRHVRFLGVPGFDSTHTHALASVIRKCGSFCGGGGIFEVEQSGKTWQRLPATDFTRDCNWMY